MKAEEAWCCLCYVEAGKIQVPDTTDALCLNCAQAVARFVLSAPAKELEKVWRVQRPKRSHGTSPDDAEAHADLAEAYLEMGLLGDALIDAANCLILDTTGALAHAAMRILLDDRILREEGIKALRTKIAAT